MTNYTMPVLSEQEREEEINNCLSDIKVLERDLSSYEGHPALISELRRQKIALAALTAEPVDPADCFCQVYLAPPVPVKQEGEQ